MNSVLCLNEMWRTLSQVTRLVAKPVRATNVNIFNKHTNKRRQYSKGLVEKNELDKILNEEIERLQKNKKLLPEEDVVPAEYQSILKELDVQYERTLDDCREAVRDPEFQEYWGLLTSRVRQAELAWAADTAPVTKQSREAFEAHIEDIIQTTDEEFFAKMKDRRRKEKEQGTTAPEASNINDEKADELIRHYLGLGLDLNPGALKDLDSLKILKEMPETEINKILEQVTTETKKINSTSHKSQEQQAQSSTESKSVTEANPNLPTTDLNQNDKLYDEYEKLIMFSNRDIDDQSREAAADRILGHMKMRDREKVLKQRREQSAKEDEQLMKDMKEIMDRKPGTNLPDSMFDLPDLFGHTTKK